MASMVEEAKSAWREVVRKERQLYVISTESVRVGLKPKTAFGSGPTLIDSVENT
jgi:hypothetical protein